MAGRTRRALKQMDAAIGAVWERVAAAAAGVRVVDKIVKYETAAAAGLDGAIVPISSGAQGSVFKVMRRGEVQVVKKFARATASGAVDVQKSRRDFVRELAAQTSLQLLSTTSDPLCDTAAICTVDAFMVRDPAVAGNEYLGYMAFPFKEVVTLLSRIDLWRPQRNAYTLGAVDGVTKAAERQAIVNRQFLRSKQAQAETARILLQQVNALHAADIAHRDIKADNVLAIMSRFDAMGPMDGTPDLLFIDFGVACVPKTRELGARVAQFVAEAGLRDPNAEIDAIFECRSDLLNYAYLMPSISLLLARNTTEVGRRAVLKLADKFAAGLVVYEVFREQKLTVPGAASAERIEKYKSEKGAQELEASYRSVVEQLREDQYAANPFRPSDPVPDAATRQQLSAADQIALNVVLELTGLNGPDAARALPALVEDFRRLSATLGEAISKINV